MHGRDADTTAAQQQLTQPTTHTVGEQVTVHRNLDHPTWMAQEFVETAQGLQIQRTRRSDLPTEMYQAEVVATGTKNGIRCVRLNNGHWYRDADGTQVGSATFITRFDQEG